MLRLSRVVLSSVAISLEMKPKLKNAIVKLRSEAMFMGIFPFPVNNLEGNVLKKGMKKTGF